MRCARRKWRKSVSVGRIDGSAGRGHGVSSFRRNALPVEEAGEGGEFSTATGVSGFVKWLKKILSITAVNPQRTALLPRGAAGHRECDRTGTEKPWAASHPDGYSHQEAVARARELRAAEFLIPATMVIPKITRPTPPSTGFGTPAMIAPSLGKSP